MEYSFTGNDIYISSAMTCQSPIAAKYDITPI